MGVSRLFLGVATARLVTNGAHDVCLSAFVIDGIAHGFAVNGQTLIKTAKLCIPCAQSMIQFLWINGNQSIADHRSAGYFILTIPFTTSETLTGFVAK